MTNDPHEAYLEAQVRTATPQRLRLMLLDGALRHARRVLQLWDGDVMPDPAYESLSRCRDIVAELYAVIKPDQTPVARRVAEIYLFLFRLLAEASINRQPQRVRDAIRILEQERETWRQLCVELPEPPAGYVPGDRGRQEITASNTPAPFPDGPLPGTSPSSVDPPGLSLEA